MTDAAGGLLEQAAKLRTAFDRAFAAPLRPDAAITYDLLAIRVGAEPYAVRLSDVNGLFVDRRITRIPGNNTSLLGIAGFRGAIVPAYSLSALLGQSQPQAPRWLVIAAAPPVALAFDLFEGHLRATADAILPQQSHAQIRGYAPNFVRNGGIVRPILDLVSVVEALVQEPSEPTHRRSDTK